ncbi:MAG: hypothetical protein ACRCRW_10470 [Aeromonadaceae bacterium]
MRIMRWSFGSSLVELMLAMLLGSALLLALSLFYLGCVRHYAERQAEQELRLSLVALLDRLEGEVRRSGYNAGALQQRLAQLPLDRPYPWHPAQNRVRGLSLPTETCLLLRSDLDGDGEWADEELSGYRFNGEQQAVEQKLWPDLASQQAQACGGRGWQDLTSDGSIQISRLSFTVPQPEVPLLHVVIEGVTRQVPGRPLRLSRDVWVRNGW